MGLPKIWNDALVFDGANNDLTEGDLKVVVTDLGPPKRYSLKIYENGAFIDFFPRLDQAGKIKAADLSRDVVRSPLAKATAILTADVVNAAADQLVDVVGLSLPVSAAGIVAVYYRFRDCCVYTVAAGSTGTRWTVSGPPTNLLAYVSRYSLTSSSQTCNQLSAYGLPAAANASTGPNGGVYLAFIEGILQPKIDGTLTVQFASGVNRSAVVAKKGSILELEKYSAI